MTPADHWTADELAVRAPLEQDAAVPMNMRRHRNLIDWAKERGVFARVDGATPCSRASASCGAERSGGGAPQRRATRTCSSRKRRGR